MNGSLARGRDPLIQKLRLMEEPETEALIQELSAADKPVILGFLNQHGYNLAQNQSRIFNSFLRMDYLLRDGIGIKLACRFNDRAPCANLNGSDFIPRLLGQLTGRLEEHYQFFAMGTQEPWLSRGAQRLFAGQPFHAIDGFRDVLEYVEFVRTHHQPGKMAVVVLAMGMPKQEEVALQLRQQLEAPALLICGGAILDFAAERFPRAPLAWRKLGLEWLFRLLMEPRRLFHRYVVGIPVFFARAWKNSRLPRPRPVEATCTAADSARQSRPLDQDDETLKGTMSP